MTDAALHTAIALYAAHLVADYVLQTDWMVSRKSDFRVLGLHILLVAICSLAALGGAVHVVLFVALAHMGIDLVKTHILRNGFGPYFIDQIAHLASIVAAAWFFPDAFSNGVWADAPPTLWPWAVLGCGAVMTSLGGMYAVDIALGRSPKTGASGPCTGIIERMGLLVMGVAGWLWLAPLLVITKFALNAQKLRDPDTGLATDFVKGTLISFFWGLGTAAVTLLVYAQV